MSSLFSRPKTPAVAPLPRDDGQDERKRLDAEREAIVAQKAAGRRSTIVAGAQIAAEEQQGRGLLRMQNEARRMVTG